VPAMLRHVSLRTRLVVTVVALVALAVAAVALAAGLALRGFLLAELDRDLGSATQRAVSSMQLIPGAPIGVASAVAIPGQSPGTLAAVIDPDGVLGSGVLGEDGATHQLDEHERERLFAAAESMPIGSPGSVELGALGSYRVMIVEHVEGRWLLVGLPLADVDATVGWLWGLSALIGIAALALATALGVVAVRRALRPLDRLVETATTVAELPLDREAALAVRVPTEVADAGPEVRRVGAAFDRMLSHVAAALSAREAGEQRLRRFVADASHELRTPLASIRGYSELVRRSGAQLPGDVAHSIDRIESEAVRMTALVEDLLLLARLDEQQPLERRPIELASLVATAVGDVQVAAPDHDWSVDAPDEVEIEGDEGRIHQAVVNLLTNAARHTPAGTAVVARVRREGAIAVIEVEDDGPGVDPALLPRVFGRFVRGEQSRSRAKGSTGLGLAIVEAIANAHGGAVDAESRPGRTVFRVRLPVKTTA